MRCDLAADTVAPLSTRGDGKQKGERREKVPLSKINFTLEDERGKGKESQERAASLSLECAARHPHVGAKGFYSFEVVLSNGFVYPQTDCKNHIMMFCSLSI